jgi:hypothetical protein
MDKKDKIGLAVGFVFFIAMGIWAILDPTAMETYAASGLANSLKQTLAEAWGPKLGMVMVGLGALALVGLHQSK